MAHTFAAPDERMPLFALRHLAFTYPDGTPGLRDITLDIHAGDRIALVGLNGSGKSTLIRHLNGLYTAQSGDCLFKGVSIGPDRNEEVRHQVGVLFQDPDDQLFSTTLYEDVAFGPRNQGKKETEVDRLVRDNLAAVGLDHLLHKQPHHLSYGQKKRAALAAVLAMEPEVLILDEPTANLDPRQEARIKALLTNYPGTLIVIEHDLLFLHELCDRAIVLADGRVHHNYNFRDLVSQPQALIDHGLDFSFRFDCCGHHRDSAGHHHHHHQPVHEHDPHAHHLPAGTDQPPLIELQHFTFRYPDGTTGVQDINLGLFAGETVALLGENGAGKSTLAFCLLGLHQGEGYLLVDGKVLPGDERSRLWQQVGMVFQQSADQLFCPSCREEVAFGPSQSGLDSGEVDRRTREALAMVDLLGYEERVPLHMSGGERKRLAIAAALSLRPTLLILDEPTAGLDPRSEAHLMEVLAALPMAKLLITHDLFFIRRLSQRTVVMHQGRIIRDYSTEEFLADEHLQAVNGLDYTYQNSCYQVLRQWRQDGEEV